MIWGRGLVAFTPIPHITMLEDKTVTAIAIASLRFMRGFIEIIYLMWMLLKPKTFHLESGGRIHHKKLKKDKNRIAR